MIFRLKIGASELFYLSLYCNPYMNYLTSSSQPSHSRIGQKKPVTIIKMVTRGTVDETIYSLQERKEKMNEAIMDEKGNAKQAGGGEDMKEIMKSVVGNFLKSPKGPSKGKLLVDQEAEKPETISIDD